MSLSDKDLNNPQQLPVPHEKPRWWSGLRSICKERWFYHFHDSRWSNHTAFSQIFYSQLLVFCHHSFDFISSQLWVVKAVFFIQDHVTGLIASKKIVGWERKFVFHIQRKEDFFLSICRRNKCDKSNGLVKTQNDNTKVYKNCTLGSTTMDLKFYLAIIQPHLWFDNADCEEGPSPIRE